MSSPVPVPSKAAIRALRGLVLGTTCTLALITEDRRRRIHAAQRALHNGEKLRSSAQYRPGGAADAIASKDEEIFLLEFHRPHGHHDHRSDIDSRGAIPPDLDIYPGPSPPPPQPAVPRREKAAAPGRAAPRPSFGIRQQTAVSEHARTSALQKRRTAPKPSEPVALHKLAAEITALVNEDKNRPRRPRLGDAAALLKRTLLELSTDIPETGRAELLEATALLSRECQDAKRMDDALATLRAVLSLGEIDEEAYLAHNPLPIVEDTLLRDRHGTTPSRRFKLAVDLFTTKLKGDPSLQGREMLRTAERLIEAGVDAGRCTLVSQILFERVNWYLGEPGSCYFLSRVFRRMHDKGMYEAVVRFFVSCSRYHANLMADKAEYYGVCDLVVQCVTESNGNRADLVLKCLRKHQPPDVNMRVAWVSELLYLHYKKNGSYNETLELFLALRGDGIAELVAYPDGVYRAIIQVALEAGEESAAQEHFSELVKQQPGCASNVRILGLFAQARARAGDWVAVDSLFRKMYPAGREVSTYGSDVLMPILKAFRDSHTADKTKAFIQLMLEELRVPLTKSMVTLVANAYGAAREVKPFLAWLKYCSDAGFRMDAAFSNAILTSCRNHWNFPFMDLKRVHRALLKSFGAACSDSVTENIITGAALAAPVSHRKVTLSLALHGKQKTRKPVVKCRRDPATVASSMATWIEVGRQDKAIRTYKFMTASGMPHCPQCLRLFAIASMKMGTDNLNEVLHVLQAVKKTGVDTSEAVVALFTADLEAVDRSLGARHVEEHVRNVLDGMQRYGLRTSSSLLNKSAAILAKAGNYEGATRLALMAAEARGEAPGYNVTNFTILFDLYSKTEQWDRLRTLFEVATDFGWWARVAGRHSNLLKRLKHMWQAQRARAERANPVALSLLETAIRNITRERDRLYQEQLAVQKGVLDMIASAAVDSGADAPDLMCGEPEEEKEEVREEDQGPPDALVGFG